MADAPCILCTRGALTGSRFELHEDRPLRIGRAPDNDVVVANDDASRYHAELLLDNGTLWLRDAGSRNGIVFRGSRLTQPKALKVGDTFDVGDHSFELRWDDDATAEPSNGEAEAPARGRRWWPFN